MGGSGGERCWLDSEEECGKHPEERREHPEECGEHPDGWGITQQWTPLQPLRGRQGVCEVEDRPCLFCRLIITQGHQIHRREQHGRKQTKKLMPNTSRDKSSQSIRAEKKET